ncbi:UvrD-helicase domain-containing protein [Tistrella bauzanensis]|uniref:DNA 3'-5' helicase n=1 Tax=Tistrella arctica TaxID=3133430 RepID=A0ABU9YR34_9PROT
MSDPFSLPEPQAPLPQDHGARGTHAYLDGLNAEQRAAVETLDGPVLVLAGAGTGKTRVLTTRLAHLVDTGRARPWQILAVTFTNKAAREMRERVARLIGGDESGLWFGTFHSLAARILRRHAELVGLSSTFTILDTDDQIRLAKQVIQAAGVDEKRWPPKVLVGAIQRWKDKAYQPAEVPGVEAHEFARGRGSDLYAAYQARLKELNAADFGDLLMECIRLFRQHPDILTDWQRRFRYILVDEYQDTNVAQYLWLRLLAQAHHNICCVGDDDQSIYSWRGAEVGNILRFETDFPDATVVRLERNYRSTGHILGAAGALIAHNEGRLGKTLWTDDGEGERVRIQGCWDGDEEARFVSDVIEHLRAQGLSLSDMAVLVRAGHQTRAFEDRFVTIGLPYRVVGGLRFFERAEVRDALAYLRLMIASADDLAFERIVNVPKRGLGDASVQALAVAARAEGVPLLVAAGEPAITNALRPKARAALGDLARLIAGWREALSHETHGEVVRRMLDESGLTGMWQAEKTPEAQGRLDNLKELARTVEEFDSLPAFLEHVSLVMDVDTRAGDEMVSLMTLHGAKGLEFDTVFLPGWEEGVFPHERALEESGREGLEEERRLAYVGLTRARRRAVISFAANRRVYNQWLSSVPSRFVEELPAAHIELSGQTGVYGGNRQGGWQPAGRGRPSDHAAPDPYAQTEVYDRATRLADDLSTRTIDGSAVRVNDRAGSGGTAGGGRDFAPRRLQPTSGRTPGQAAAAAKAADTSSFKIGMRVSHAKYGAGFIERIEGDKLQVVFDGVGRKKVIDRFVEPV